MPLGPTTPMFSVDAQEAFVDRQGQLIMWDAAQRCPCIVEESGTPDYACPLCHPVNRATGQRDTEGGWIWRHPTYSVPIVNECNCIGGKGSCPPIPPNSAWVVYTINSPIVSVSRVRNVTKGFDYVVQSYSDNHIHVTGYAPIDPTDDVCVDYRYQDYNTVTGEDASHNGTWIIEVENPIIAQVESVENVSTGETYTVSDWWYNWIELSGSYQPQADETLSVNYTWYSPITAQVTSVQPSKNWTNMGEMRVGDSVLTLPFGYNIGERDRITILNAQEIISEVLTRGNVDKLRNKEVAAVFEVFSKNAVGGTTTTSYVEGTDWRLRGGAIEWIPDGTSPATDQMYTVSYAFRPVYRIYRLLPMTRTHENQLLLKKAVMRRDDLM